MASKNKFEVNGDNIHISRPEWDFIGLCSYREDYFDEITSVTWGLSNGYISNSKLGTLHRYMMEKWYGKDTLDKFIEDGFVVDHLNNNHTDNRIENLEFLLKDYNTAKGQAFDKDSDRLTDRLAVRIFKDFSTERYQIAIGCNDAIYGEDENGRYLVNAFKLLYDSNYPIVINDAHNILLIYETEGRISLSKTNAKSCRIYRAPELQLTEEEKKQAFVERNGVQYLILGNSLSKLDSVHFDKGWDIPEE